MTSELSAKKWPFMLIKVWFHLDTLSGFVLIGLSFLIYKLSYNDDCQNFWLRSKKNTTWNSHLFFSLLSKVYKLDLRRVRVFGINTFIRCILTCFRNILDQWKQQEKVERLRYAYSLTHLPDLYENIEKAHTNLQSTPVS